MTKSLAEPVFYNESDVIYACYSNLTRSNDDFIGNHMLGLIVEGSLTVVNGNEIKTFQRNEVLLYQKNKLARFIKQPENGKPFESISIIFDEIFLDEFAQRNNLASTTPLENNFEVLIEVKSDAVTELLRKLLVVEPINAEYITLAKCQLVSNLISLAPEIKDILFDFSKPWKIDLEPFMNKHFRHSLPAEKLAYLTGRSLATFKRDFKKTFKSTPNRWVQSKRLEEAYFLIYRKGKKPVDIYLDLGFESISHFSYAFKKFFGINASKLPTKTAVLNGRRNDFAK